MTKPTDGIVSTWLRAETPEHLDLLTKLRQKLVSTMDYEVTENGTPSRDWCRGFQRYQNGYQMLLVEERERAKLRLLMQKSGQTVLTDEEYEQDMQQLKAEVLGEIDAGDLAAELVKRGLPVPESRGPDELD